MNIKETISTINKMQADGVIGRYAIGGAIGASFYLEPAETQDVDVFVILTPEPGRLIVDPSRIYDYLTARGYNFIEVDGVKTDYIGIAGWPVQFLPADKPLLKEALEDSVERNIDDLPVWVFSAEHLAAIALALGRGKDRTRLAQFLEANIIDEERFNSILERHELLDRWAKFKKQLED